jgi:hypothetical protein
MAFQPAKRGFNAKSGQPKGQPKEPPKIAPMGKLPPLPNPIKNMTVPAPIKAPMPKKKK